MRITWYGQSAFHLAAPEGSAFIDPFGAFPKRDTMRFDYPAIPRLAVDLLLITHEHFDHNGKDALEEPKGLLRSTAGRFQTPLGEVLAVASEHDPVAGTQRGPNSIFVFTLGGLRVCHLGDFGQAHLRPEQREAIGAVDLLFVPVGGGPTIDAAAAQAIAAELSAKIVVPMHYRTPAVNFLETADDFLARCANVVHLPSAFDTDELPSSRPLCAVPAAPVQ